MYEHFNSDTAGVKITKPTPTGFVLVLGSFQEAADWVKGYLRGHGYDVMEAVFDPYSNRWMFYSHEGTFIIALDHDYMERLLGVLLWKEYPK